MTKVLCNFNSACAENLQMLTSGMVGVQIAFEFSAEWDGLTKTAVFKAGDTQRDVLLTGDTVTIPWEVLAVPREVLVVGVYGMRGVDLVIPTIYTPLGRIQQGADPSGDPGIPPTPSVLERAIEATVAAAELAAAAAAGSAAEAESASDDAENAQRAAETAKTEAESAKSGAESAATNAEEAKLGAEAAFNRAKTAAAKQPYPNAETGTWWVWDAESGVYSDSGEQYKGKAGDTGAAGKDGASMVMVDASNYEFTQAEIDILSQMKGQTLGPFTALDTNGAKAGDALAIVVKNADRQCDVVVYGTATEVEGNDISFVFFGMTEGVQKPLTGSTDEITPEQVITAVKSGRPVVLSCVPNGFSYPVSFTAFEILSEEEMYAVHASISSSDPDFKNYVTIIELFGVDGSWMYYLTTIDTLKNPYSLTLSGGVSAVYDGSAAVSVKLPATHLSAAEPENWDDNDTWLEVIE